MGSAMAVSNYRKRRKENLIKVCGSQCCICGYHKTNTALEFHHIIPEEKNFGIAENGVCRDLETDLQEAKKCILVCANCHREIHEGFYSVQELCQKKVYDEKFADWLREDKKNKTTKQECYCKDCGKIITKDTITGLCGKCYAKSSRRVERPNREDLKIMIRTMPFTEIGKQFNVSDNAIKKWCKSENLPTKKSEIKLFSDAQWELV